MEDDDCEYVSYKSPKTIMAETVYHFFRGGLYGACFGMVCRGLLKSERVRRMRIIQHIYL